MCEGEQTHWKKLLPQTHFLVAVLSVMVEIALSVIVSANKLFTALFLFKFFPGKSTGSSFRVWPTPSAV